jgi:hypothetical protein
MAWLYQSRKAQVALGAILTIVLSRLLPRLGFTAVDVNRTARHPVANSANRHEDASPSSPRQQQRQAITGDNAPPAPAAKPDDFTPAAPRFHLQPNPATCPAREAMTASRTASASTLKFIGSPSRHRLRKPLEPTYDQLPQPPPRRQREYLRRPDAHRKNTYHVLADHAGHLRRRRNLFDVRDAGHASTSSKPGRWMATKDRRRWQTWTTGCVVSRTDWRRCWNEPNRTHDRCSAQARRNLRAKARLKREAARVALLDGDSAAAAELSPQGPG